jgi:hypothetical protein
VTEDLSAQCLQLTNFCNRVMMAGKRDVSLIAEQRLRGERGVSLRPCEQADAVL